MARTGLKKMKCSLSLSRDELLALLENEKNGKPNYGAILQYYRLQKGWSVADLVLSYSKALKRDASDDGSLIATSWIYMMENQNMVPADEKRRWILAILLDIPPLLFGLKPLENLPRQDSAMFGAVKWEPVDIEEYRLALQEYRGIFKTGLLHEIIPDIKRRINNLNNETQSKRASEKRNLIFLLCEYEIELAYIAYECSQFDVTIQLLSNVILIAATNKLHETWAYALRQRGNAYLSRGMIKAGLVHFELATQDFQLAVADFEAIRAFETNLSSQRKALVWLIAGDVYGHVARNQQELTTALKLVDRASNEIGKGGDDSTILDEERYHLDRGNTLVASPFIRFPKDACREYDLATEQTKSLNTLRHVSTAIRQAEAYFYEGRYPMALAYTEDGLSLIQDPRSSRYFPRVQNLYQALKESPYGNNCEVAELGVEITKVQYPELFP